MEWKEVRLGDYVSIKSGLAYKGKFIGKGCNTLLGMGCVSFTENFLMSGARPYDDDCDDRYCVKPGDIVLATRQQSDNLPILAMPAIIPDNIQGEKIIFGTNLYKIDNQSEIDNEYLFWQLKTPNYVDYITSVKTGSVVRMVTKKDIENYVFKCPPKETRDKISGLLWNINSKIETNKKLNTKLEELAQTIFKSWFVDFEPFKDQKMVESELGLIPEGWKVGKLSDVADITMGQSPAGETLNEEGEGIIFYQGCRDFTFRYPNIRVYTTAPTRFAEPDSVLFSVRAPVGAINRAASNCCIGRGLASIKAKNGNDSFVYYLIHSLKDAFDRYNGEGTVFGCINKKGLEGFKIILPPNDIIKKYNNAFAVVDKQIETNEKENQRLTSLRDTLLPKFMSGEIEI